MHRVLVIVVACILSAACSTYSYNNQTYKSASAALEGQREFQQAIVSKMTASAVRISGRALVITPSKSTCAALGIVKKGAPKQEIIDYVSTNLEREYAYFAKYLEKSQLFSGVDSRVVDHPQADARALAKDYAATIYLAMTSPSQAGWFMLVPGSDQPIQINFDSLSEPGAPRIRSWVAAIASNTKT